MSDQLKRTRLQTEAIVIGYAMSRLDTTYLSTRKCLTWNQVFAEAADALRVRPGSLKNLHDEFDPIHGNPRKGRHKRMLRPNRQRVLDELREVSDDALLELVARILKRDEGATVEAIDSLATVTRVAHNVAERLLTGRRVEEHFLAHSEQIISVQTVDILDFRQAACGFDFGVRGQAEWAIEVKGLKRVRGDIQFTDREWTEAKYRRENYWLVIVGNLAAKPLARVIRDPHAVLKANCAYQASLTAIWRSTVSVDS
ncbi:MAG TPA: DUF3883 domain-containing protein [Candidatus Binatia bacterium]|nr:DUF3883 domain-containing protein [Candidatus Binatia bacterium]